jgi:threonylcarbamoyladenosine tRNA methylthiotransferase MtaB
MKKPTFTIRTLGCKVNQYESQVMREALIRLGFREVGASSADAGIINSCTVTAKADSKTRKLIHKLKKENPSMKIFATGCCAVFEEDIKTLGEMPEVYRVIPNKEKMALPSAVNSVYCSSAGNEPAKERVSGFDSHTRAFLKIQDGCDQTCSYCKVNLVRGPSRSKEKNEILEELEHLTGAGYKEIVLTGICLGAWKGPGGEKLSDLLNDIEKIEGDYRIRLSSIEPNHIDDTLIGSITGSKRICRHLHIPLQSGSGKVLKAMNRRYDPAQFEELIRKLRAKEPLMGITMDVIVGFPGETENDFKETFDFIRRVRPSRMHVFSYSDRKGTRSFGMKDKVPSDEIKKRADRLIELGEKLKSEFCRQFIGREVEVLVEKRTKNNAPGRASSLDNIPEGYTGEYVKVRSTDFSGREGSLIRTKAAFVGDS